MKHLAAALIVLTISSGTFAHAGGLKDPILEKELIIETAQAGSSSSGITLVALMSVLVFATVLSN